MRTTREPDNDAALMRAFASRDRNAADTLYARFASRIYGLGIVMLGSDAAAQDLVQDTFVKLWRNADPSPLREQAQVELQKLEGAAPP